MAISNFETRFLYIAFFDAQLMVIASKLQLDKSFGQF